MDGLKIVLSRNLTEEGRHFTRIPDMVNFTIQKVKARPATQKKIKGHIVELKPRPAFKRVKATALKTLRDALGAEAQVLRCP